MILAGYGARVIRVEPSGSKAGSLDVIPLEGLLRGKELVRIDLKDPAGLAGFLALADRADVVLDGFRPGVTARLGIDPPSLRRRNPRLVTCSITGYGGEGAGSGDAGHDLNYLASAGILDLLTPSGELPRAPALQLADLAGALHATIGILSALRHRDRTGEGLHVDVSMTDAALFLAILPMAFRTAGLGFRAGESWLAGGLACYGVYRCADHGRLAVAALEPRFFRAFLGVLGLEALAPRQYLPDGQERLREAISSRLMEHPLPWWIAAFEGVDACVTPVLSFDEALEHERFHGRGQLYREDGDLLLDVVARLRDS